MLSSCLSVVLFTSSHIYVAGYQNQANPSHWNKRGSTSTASQPIPAYTTSFVITSTSYRMRGFSSAENILRSCSSSSLPLSFGDRVGRLLSGDPTCNDMAAVLSRSCRALDAGAGLRCPSAVSLNWEDGMLQPSDGFRRLPTPDERLSLRFCSLLAMYSRTSASDCGPTEMVLLRVLESIAGISEAGGSTLSSLRSGGTFL